MILAFNCISFSLNLLSLCLQIICGERERERERNNFGKRKRGDVDDNRDNRLPLTLKKEHSCKFGK